MAIEQTCPRRPSRLGAMCALALAVASFDLGCSLSFDTGALPDGGPGGPLQNDAGTPDNGSAPGNDGDGGNPDAGSRPDAGDSNSPAKPQPPQFIGMSTDSESDATGFVVSKPTGTLPGDLLLVSIYVTDQQNVITFPGMAGDWHPIDTHVLTKCQATTVWAYHVYSNSDPSPYYFGIQYARFVESLALMAYRGVDSKNPIGQHVLTEFSATLSYGPVLLTTDQANETLVLMSVNEFATGAWSWPQALQWRADTNVLGVFDEPRVTAGTTNPRTVTSTGDASKSCGDVELVGLRPAPL